MSLSPATTKWIVADHLSPSLEHVVPIVHDDPADFKLVNSDASKVMPDGGEDGVGGVAGGTFEKAAAEMTIGLEVTDHGLV
jgi:hypothetical protein